MPLQQPLPPQVRVIRATRETITVQMTLPTEVADRFSLTLEYAARMTGSDKLGAMMAAIAAECLSTWMPLEIEQEARTRLRGGGANGTGAAE